MTGTTGQHCAVCQAPYVPEDRFCEQCGARFEPEQHERGACLICGARDAIDADGYCSVCGARARAAEDRDELDLAVAAAVSDRGRVHRRNEDAFALKLVGDGGVAAVVCDGISSSSAGDAAARSAADAAGAALALGLSGAGEGTSVCLRDAGLAAILAARAAVSEVRWTTRADRAMPSCTLVGALWREQEITLISVGDSRAYWIGGADGPRQLTTDDSWAEEQVAAGNLTWEQALADRRAHAITNWIGPDAPDRAPRVEILRPTEPGRLLLCSDGLWNYVPDPAALGELTAALPDGASAAAIARALTDTALARGGRDNITVVVIDVQPRRGVPDGRIHS